MNFGKVSIGEGGKHSSVQSIGSIDNIPIFEKNFDLILCVGSVINYCDPIKVVSEFKKVLNHNGCIILEFENSYTFELIFKKEFNRSTALIETFYNNEKETIWYYSEKYITAIFIENGFKIEKIKRFHILSPLIYRITNSEKIAALFSIFDIILQYIPIVNKFSSNVIFVLKLKNLK